MQTPKTQKQDLVPSLRGLNLTALRALRVLRPLRAIKRIEALKMCIETLFQSAPDILNVRVCECVCVCVFVSVLCEARETNATLHIFSYCILSHAESHSFSLYPCRRSECLSPLSLSAFISLALSLSLSLPLFLMLSLSLSFYYST